MGKFNDITGQTFWRLTVAGYSHSSKERKALWNCVCECGKNTVVYAYNLKTGNTKSCGCGHGIDTNDFDSCYIPVPESGCWLWLGKIDNKGYGRIGRGQKQIKAYRYSYELYNGPIPENAYILHKCDIPLCVNPDHLYIGTHQDNMRDLSVRGQSGTRKLTADQVLQIRESTLRQSQISKQHSVSQTTISAIKSGKTWRHL